MSLGALALIDVVVDPGTWSCWDVPISGVPQDVRYAEALSCARKKTGLDESVVTGE
ncbi:MAG: acetyl-coA carboxylase, partial [Frankiales bacterium]|nr:acetyl-coA carboxylase [Frankiales bacterium]